MEAPKGKAYDGPSGIARDSQWLTAEDLIQGRDQKVKVALVKRYDNVEFKGGKGGDRTKRILLSLKFDGKERELGLNRTNTKILNRMFGSRTGGWVGREVALYVTQVMAFGEMVDCVRIRDMGSRAASAAEQFLDDRGQSEEDPKGPALDAGNGASMDVTALEKREAFLSEARERISNELTKRGLEDDAFFDALDDQMKQVEADYDRNVTAQ